VGRLEMRYLQERRRDRSGQEVRDICRKGGIEVGRLEMRYLQERRRDRSGQEVRDICRKGGIEVGRRLEISAGKEG
jgi:hypothetical protein